MPEKQDNNSHGHGHNQNHGHKKLQHNVEYTQYTRVYQMEPDNARSEGPLIKYLNVDKIKKIPTYRSNYANENKEKIDHDSNFY